MPGPDTALAYIRVSTARQFVEGRSLEDQESSIRDYCERRGLALVGTHRERGVSGFELNRPQLGALRRRLRAGNVHAVVVSHLDRVTRHGLHLKTLLGELHNTGVRLVTT